MRWIIGMTWVSPLTYMLIGCGVGLLFGKFEVTRANQRAVEIAGYLHEARLLLEKSVTNTDRCIGNIMEPLSPDAVMRLNRSKP